jgi:hypothetical protein
MENVLITQYDASLYYESPEYEGTASPDSL